MNTTFISMTHALHPAVRYGSPWFISDYGETSGRSQSEALALWIAAPEAVTMPCAPGAADRFMGYMTILISLQQIDRFIHSRDRGCCKRTMWGTACSSFGGDLWRATDQRSGAQAAKVD